MPLESNQTRPARVQSSTAAYPPPNLTDPLPCPRCNSTITKFCYYNNYHLSQPRYFCRSCRRYWTHGGTLRDVPVGGGTRRNTSSKRHRTFSSSSSSSSCSSLTTTTTTTTKSETAMKKGEDKNEGNNVISGYGSFASLLDGEGAAAFLALGSGSDCGFGFGGGDTWQFGDVDGSKSGDSFTWPAL
ncbi:unnamed protein product [Cochlearia groenlandica]